MNYEELKYGDENSYRADQDGYITKAEEDEANNAFESWAYQDALRVIEEANAIVENIDDYDDLVAANTNIVEYREVVLEYETNHNIDLVNRIKSLEKIIIDLSALVSDSILKASTPKTTITVKEFEKMYSINEEAQRKLRGRYNDPLPFEQATKRGTILYDIKDVDKWRENYKKNGI